MKDSVTSPSSGAQSTIVYGGKKISVQIEEIAVAGGSYTHQETVLHPGAVVILPIGEEGSLYFVSQYRHSVRRHVLELPAGTLNPNEDPAACARRELQEELSLAASTWHELGTLLPAPGFCNEVQFIFVARDLSSAPGIPDADEVLTTQRLSPREVKEAIASFELLDGKSLATILRAVIAGHWKF